MTDSPHIVVHKKITPRVIQVFKDYAPKGKLNSQTIHDDGEGNLAGFIAEHYMLDILMKVMPDADISYDADISMDYDILVQGTKIDVKTKMRTSMIQPDYDVSIAEYTISKQDCDIYAFCSVTFNPTKTTPLDFYYIGMRTKAAYIQNARVLKKGQRDGDNILPNGKPFTVRKDCRNLRCDELKQYPEDVLSPLLKSGYDFIYW